MAISEEFANDAAAKVKSGGLSFNRRVTRVVTPGTLVDEKFMDPSENNFLLAIFANGNHCHSSVGSAKNPAEPVEMKTAAKLMEEQVGLAWLDLSTGEFFTQLATVGTLASVIVRIGAREILMINTLDEFTKETLLSILANEQQLITWQPYPSTGTSVLEWTHMLESSMSEPEQAKFEGNEIMAGAILLNYTRERLIGLGIKLQPPIRRQMVDNMGIDRNSMSGLEILATSREGIVGGKGSLLHSMRRTVTRSGARLLRDRIGELAHIIIFLRKETPCGPASN